MKENILHYLVLLVILNLGVGSFFLFSFNRLSQMLVIGSLGIFYIIWGIIHHLLSGDLHFKVILEYILIALLANLVIFFLLFRA
jgi:hypothetical protein